VNDSETGRLQDLWSGDFGDAYVERNAKAHEGREPFWRERLETLGVTSALEIGCNVGGNLVWIGDALGAANVAGIEINETAAATARRRLPEADIRIGQAAELPFEDGQFDLVFTAGVLIHQSRESLPSVLDEMIRVSKRFVLAAEYFADEPTEIPYRGHDGALFKDDYGRLIAERDPKLEQIEKGFLDSGSWDDVTYWTFRKPE
jgi:pseudaminic acid biosynthesis-associated methylase